MYIYKFVTFFNCPMDSGRGPLNLLRSKVLLFILLDKNILL